MVPQTAQTRVKGHIARFQHRDSDDRLTNVTNTRPTIYDVARVAGVSKSVVSRVVSGKGSVSDHSRTKVESAIAQLGYSPYLAERSTKPGSSGTIGLLLRNVTSPYYARLFADLQNLAARDETRIVAVTGNMVPGSEMPMLTSLLELGVDGLIVGSGLLANRAVARISADTPTVVVSRPAPNTEASAVYDDPELIAHYVIDSLWSCGHRSALLIDHPHAYSAKPRTEAIQRIALERGLHILAIPGGYEVEHGRAAVDSWWELREQHTAVITLSPLAALGFLEKLKVRGLGAPQDVSIVSADTRLINLPLNIALTGFRRDSDALATAVWREILRRTDGATDPQELRIGGTWHEGATLGSLA